MNKIDSLLCKNCSKGQSEPTKTEYAGYTYYCPKCRTLKDDGSDAKKGLIKQETAKSVTEFLNIINKYKKSKWFRGVSNKNYALKPAIGRINISEK